MDLPISTASSHDNATVIAVGALAATLAAVFHEALGHGLGCLGIGGHITLVTSIWFRCSRWAAVTDAGGPIGNLVAGSVALALLGNAKPGPSAKLLLLMLAALNLFWFTGQLAFESVTGTRDDWYSVATQLGWPAIWRPVGAIVGIGGYILVGRLIAALLSRYGGPPAHAIRLAYAAAAASAIIAGLMWQPEPLRTAAQGFLTLGIAPLGLFGLARRTSRDAAQDVSIGSVPRSWVWISVCVVVFAVFIFVQARGFGPLAGSKLSP